MSVGSGTRMTAITVAAREIMDLSMSSRFDLVNGQEVSIGAGPS